MSDPHRARFATKLNHPGQKGKTKGTAPGCARLLTIYGDGSSDIYRSACKVRAAVRAVGSMIKRAAHESREVLVGTAHFRFSRVGGNNYGHGENILMYMIFK